MSNLLKETTKELRLHKKKWSDVKWIGTYKGRISIYAFKKYANKDYDSGYGIEYVNLNLLVVGEDWWMERHEYDGSEWWEFKTVPTMPENQFRVVCEIKDTIWER